jgi:hypothetical protein
MYYESRWIRCQRLRHAGDGPTRYSDRDRDSEYGRPGPRAAALTVELPCPLVRSSLRRFARAEPASEYYDETSTKYQTTTSHGIMTMVTPGFKFIQVVEISDV